MLFTRLMAFLLAAWCAIAPLVTVARAEQKPLDDMQLAACWADLEKGEADAARALLKLADRPGQAVALLREKLRPLKIDAERVQLLLVNLGSDDEQTWKSAFEELEYFDPRLAIGLEMLMEDIRTSPARQ